MIRDGHLAVAGVSGPRKLSCVVFLIRFLFARPLNAGLDCFLLSVWPRARRASWQAGTHLHVGSPMACSPVAGKKNARVGGRGLHQG
jgi:hypothetical protein